MRPVVLVVQVVNQYGKKLLLELIHLQALVLELQILKIDYMFLEVPLDLIIIQLEI